MQRPLSPRELTDLQMLVAKIDELALRDELQPELREMVNDINPSVMLWGRDGRHLL